MLLTSYQTSISLDIIQMKNLEIKLWNIFEKMQYIYVAFNIKVKNLRGIFAGNLQL
jgi:hypothetical protein